MMNYKKKGIRNERGFALLLSVLVSVIILTVGLTILNSSLKQLFLSEVSLESERSFHAAYAGVECAQFWNIDDAWDVGASPQNVRCIDQVVTTTSVCTSPTLCVDNANEIKSVQFDWTSADTYPGSAAADAYTYDMCTDITVYKYYNTSGITEMTVLPSTFANRFCALGVECTVVESRGYNRPCGSLGDIRTVEREITVRF